MLKKLVALIVILLLTACRPAATPDAPPTVEASSTPTPTATPLGVTCADIDANWGSNWPATLDALDRLIRADQSCGPEPLPSKQYAAYFNYAATLEGEGQTETAISQYQAALAVDPQRREALDALLRLEALPPPTPPACRSTAQPLPDPASNQPPDLTQFVTVEGDQLWLAGEPFTVKGVNYYPRHAPWERFYTEADETRMAQELDVMQAAGINTLRVFLTYRFLFTCQPEEAIPNEAAFARLDTLFQLAAARDLKLIISLNDNPDLLYRPLYTDWAHYDAQTIYIVRRYRHEASLLAWDVRNSPDLDAGNAQGRYTSTDIRRWLRHITRLIRAQDPHHLITAAMVNDPRPTAAMVDIVAFQHWGEPDSFAQRLETYQAEIDKPLLLIATGQHSWSRSPENPQDEAAQATYLAEMTRLAEAQGVGWVVWTAFDFVPAAGQPDNVNFHFGLWRTDLQPKPAVARLPLE